MNYFHRIFLVLLALTMLFTACGAPAESPATPEEDPGPSINYEDYIRPVVDRRVGDLIPVDELSTIMSVEVAPIDAATTDSVITYQSENGYYTVTMVLEKRTRDEFDALVADATVWTSLPGVGEAAYWGVDQIELVAYQNGYALSVSGDHVIPGCLQSIMLRALQGLEE